MNTLRDIIIIILMIVLCVSTLAFFVYTVSYFANTISQKIQKEKKRRLYILRLEEEKRDKAQRLEQEKWQAAQLLAQKKRQVAQMLEKEKKENTLRTLEQHKTELGRINNLLTQAIKPFADEKPCPNCNELEVSILEFSPNARSIIVGCWHCGKNYRIKLDPNNSVEILELFQSFCDKAKFINEVGDPYGISVITRPYWAFTIHRNQSGKREAIPKHVKKAVWTRDSGQCANCGSHVDLQYDHIIPVSKGGSSTVENLQILCKTCNLKKHAAIE